MIEDSDEEITELDIQSKSYDNLKKRLKTLGFQEGVAKGRDNLLQEGFNLGYSEGFRVGYQIGLAKGIIRYNGVQNSINRNQVSSSSCLKERQLDDLGNQSCDLCRSDTSYDVRSESDAVIESFENVVKRQQKQADVILEAVQNFILTDKA